MKKRMQMPKLADGGTVEDDDDQELASDEQAAADSQPLAADSPAEEDLQGTGDATGDVESPANAEPQAAPGMPPTGDLDLSQLPMDRQPPMTGGVTPIAPTTSPFTPSSNVKVLGPPPAFQSPGIGRRIGAGLAGGLAGWLNARAGRPGGIARPIDSTQAVQNILGVTGYQRKLANWQQQVKLAEYEDTQQQQAQEYGLKHEEAMARNAYLNNNAQYLNEARMGMAAQRKAAADAAIERSHEQQAAGLDIESPTVESSTDPGQFTVSPIQEAGLQADDLPGTKWQGPQLPPELAGADMSQLPLASRRGAPSGATVQGMPQMPTATVPGGYTPAQVPPWMAGQVPPGSQAFSISPAQQKANALVQAQQAEQARQLAVNAAKPAKPPMDVRDALLLRAQGKTTGVPVVDAMSAQEATASIKLEHPPTQLGVTIPGPTPQQQALLNQPLQPGQKNEAYLATLPRNMQNMVKQLDSYSAPISPSQLSPRRGQDNSWAEAAQHVMNYDPNWRMGDYQLVQQGMKQFTSGGPEGRNLASLNTLTGHLDDFIKDLGALNNGDNRAINSLNNYIGNVFGAPAPNNAQLAKTAVAAELANALKGNATDTEINQWVQGLNANMSPAQQQQAKQTLLGLMYRRLAEQSYRFQTIPGMNGQAPPNIMSPNTAKQLQQAGFDLSVIDPQHYKSPQAGAAGAGGGGRGGATHLYFDAKGNPIQGNQ